MGSFDFVRAKCPQCGETLEFQSKAGKCHQLHHHLTKVPTVVALDLETNLQHCKCGAVIQLRCMAAPRYLAMTAAVVNEDELCPVCRHPEDQCICE